MKKSYVTMISLAALLVLASGIPSSAYHDGGVARCSGCHSMHMAPAADPTISGGGYLTTGVGPTDTCLNCHAGSNTGSSSQTIDLVDGEGNTVFIGGISDPTAEGYEGPVQVLDPATAATTQGYHIFSDYGDALTAGGDFFWLTANYSWVSRGRTRNADPDQKGHNVINQKFGVAKDATLDTAPGGTYNSNNLHCNSCHDPHGQVNRSTGQTGHTPNLAGSGALGTLGNNAPIEASSRYWETAGVVGNFRLLGDTGYDGGKQAGGAFANPAPFALPVSYAETTYGSGMSEWCANCHTGFLTSSHDTMHPAGNAVDLGNYAANYGAYVKTGTYNTGATDYSEMVPVEFGSVATTTLAQLNNLKANGATTNSNVMCLTCHRAHGSAFDNAARWDFGATLLVHDSVPNGSETGMNATQASYAYYAKGAPIDVQATYGEFQRSLCNKCHVQD